MADDLDGGPRFYQIEDVPAREVVAQMHGARRAGVHLRVLESNADRFIAHTRYDPNLIIARHAHRSAFFVYILEGELTVGDRLCLPGTLIVMEKDVFFGPLIAGPDGCTFIEAYGDDVGSVHEDEAAYQRLLAERGIVPVPSLRDTPEEH